MAVHTIDWCLSVNPDGSHWWRVREDEDEPDGPSGNKEGEHEALRQDGSRTGTNTDITEGMESPGYNEDLDWDKEASISVHIRSCLQSMFHNKTID